MKKVLVAILAVVVNIITFPFQALSLIGIKKRLEKADENLEHEIKMICEWKTVAMCDGRTFNYDQFIDLKKILVSHYKGILEGPTKIWVKWGYWVAKYIPYVQDYLDTEYYGSIDSYVSAELICSVAISY